MRRDERGDGPKRPRWDKGDWVDILLLMLLAAAILFVLKALAVC